MTGSHEVWGSIPHSSTKYKKGTWKEFPGAFFCVFICCQQKRSMMPGYALTIFHNPIGRIISYSTRAFSTAPRTEIAYG